ncbi:hypothetical protein AB0C10_16295 [Microbispora amethystogenes]|uniref:hypothetical protein n=1 Tax=Microbispora amethystogenes TaxID=1427754 RepID=UPI0033CB6C35
MHHIARAECRRQRHRNLMRLAWELASRSAGNMVTAPKRGATWDVLAEEVGVCRRTIAYLIAWLKDHRLLITVTPGSTPRTRSGNLWGLLDDGQGNLAAEYALTVPAELLGDDHETGLEVETDDDGDDDEIPWPVETVTERPTFSHVSGDVDNLCTPAVHGCSREVTFPYAGARETRDSTGLISAWSRLETPRTRRDQLAACERLRTDHRLTLGVLSARDLRSLLRPAFVAGFSLADVEHALNRRPDDQLWGDIDPGRLVATATRVKVLRSRIRHRIGAWVTSEGVARAASPSQQVREAEESRRRGWWQHFRMVYGEDMAPTFDAIRDRIYKEAV